MKISVIIPAYNCREMLEYTVQALETQDFPKTDFEVIVIDDGSTDGTADYLQKYRGSLQLKPVINGENLGRARSRNLGIDAAQGELIVFLDADTEPAHQDFLQLHWAAQSTGRKVAVGLRKFHPEFKKTGIMRYLEKRGGAKYPPGSDLPGRYFVSCNASLPKAVLIEEGGFDPRLLHYGGEDLELGHRLSLRLPLRSLPSALCWHRHYRQLSEVLRVTEVFGEYSLPFIFHRHPELMKQLSFENINIKNTRDLFIKFICIKPIFSLVKLLVKFDFMPLCIYNYLIFRSYREGYLRSLKVCKSKESSK